MTEEIKETFRRMNDLIEHRFDKEYHTECDLFKDIQDLLDYITNLQQDLNKANDIIKKDRQFYKCIKDEYAELKKKNEKFKNIY